MTKVSILVFVGCTALGANEPGAKPDLSGTWRLESAAGNQHERWIIEQHPEKIRIQRLDPAGKVLTDIACGTRGVECPVKSDGDEAKVTYYFNGPALVELMWKGKQVTKTRRSLAPDRSKLIVEVMPMSPPGQAEKFTFVKTAEAAKR